MSTAVVISFGRNTTGNPNSQAISRPTYYAGSNQVSVVSEFVAFSPEPVYRFNDYVASIGMYDALWLHGINTGSLLGNMNTWEMLDQSYIMTGPHAGMHSGTWSGNTNTFGMHVMPADDLQNVPATSDNPITNQSAEIVEWNHFPFPPAPPGLGTKDRDMSRYRKVYGFSRQQPVRLRIFR